MKFLLPFLLLSLSLHAITFDDWIKEASQDPYAQESILEKTPKIKNINKELSKHIEIAGPFSQPVTNIKHVFTKGVKTNKEQARFVNDKKLRHTFPVFRYKINSEGGKALLIIKSADNFTAFLNGKPLDQLEGGLAVTRRAISPHITLKKGENHLILMARKEKSNMAPISFIPITDSENQLIKAELQKFKQINNSNLKAALDFFNDLKKSNSAKAKAYIIQQIIKDIDYTKSPAAKHVVYHDLDDRLVYEMYKQLKPEEMAKAITTGHLHVMKKRLLYLIQNDEGAYLEKLYAASHKLIDKKRGYDYANAVHEVAEAMMNNGNLETANKLFKHYKSLPVKGHKHYASSLEARIIDTSNYDRLKPLFVSDPETEIYRHDIDALLKENPNEETFSRLFKIIRQHSDKLYIDRFKQRSLHAYLMDQFVMSESFKNNFAAYLTERYQKDISKAIDKQSISELTEILKTTKGFCHFPQAHSFLMDHYLNQGELSQALLHAQQLINDPTHAATAASIILMAEEWLAIPQNQRLPIPAKLLKSNARVAGNRQSLESLYNRFRKTSKSSNGPGKLVAQIELANVENSSLSASPFKADSSVLTIPRQPLELNNMSGNWLSASPMGVNAFDAAGKRIWQVNKPLKAKIRKQTAPRTYRGQVIGNTFFNVEYPVKGKGQVLIARDFKGNTLWKSSDLIEYNKWEAASLPYQKLGTNIILLVEKQRTSAPVLALGYINLKNGSLEQIIELCKIRDPYQGDSKYDISQIIRFYDRFTEDEKHIYMMSGSGQILAINALHKTVSWVHGLSLRSFKNFGTPNSWNLVSTAASPYIQTFDKKLVTFCPARMGWFGLNSQSGNIIWRNFIHTPNYIHSRNSKHIVFSYKRRGQQQQLISLSPDTGNILWQKNLFGLQIIGEGAIQGKHLYLPAIKSILKFDAMTGGLVDTISTNIQAYKIRYAHNSWQMINRKNAFVFANEGEFPQNLKPALKPVNVKPQEQVIASRQKDTLEAVIDFPFTSKPEGNDLRTYQTSLPSYSLITFKNEVALFKEGGRTDDGYSPPAVIWNNTFEDYEVSGDYVLSKNSSTVEVIDAFTGKTILYFTPRGLLSSAKTSKFRINAAHIDNHKLYIATKGGMFKIFDLKQRKLLKNKPLACDDFVVHKDYLLTMHGNSTREKVTLYKMGEKFEVLKEFKEKFDKAQFIKTNGKVIGWYHYAKLNLLNLEKREIKTFNTAHGHFFDWQINERYAVLSDHKVIDLHNFKEIKVDSIILGEGGAAFIQGSKWRFAGDAGIIDLEESAKDIYQPSKQLTGNHKSTGELFVRNNELIVTTNEMENVYDALSGKLLSRKMWGDYRYYKAIVHTANSRVILRNGRAYIYSNHSSYDLPASPVITSDAKVDELFWQKVSTEKWLSSGNNQAPEMHYRLQDTPETLHLQVKLKSNTDHIFGLGLSLNSLRFDHGIYAEKVENSLGKTSIENTPSDQLIEFYIDDMGNKIFDFKVSKTDIMKNGFEGHLQFEVFSTENGQKTGAYRIGGCYAPKLKLMIPTPAGTEHVISKTQYEKLTKLYTEASSFVADGKTLSQYIKTRRLLHGFDDTIAFLESTLKRQAKNTTAIAVLAALMLEKVEKTRTENLSDEAILNVERECRSLATSLKINNDWIDNALTFIDMDFVKGQNPIALPRRAGIDAYYFMDFCGTYQFSATDGRILFPLGFMADHKLSKVHRLHIQRNSKYPTAMGKINLLKHGKLTELVAENGQANKAMIHSSWQNEYEKVYDYTGEERKQVWGFKWGPNLTFTKLNQVLLNRTYNWTEEALLQNLRLNPVSEPVAARLLRDWLHISKVKPEKLSEVCQEIIGNDRYNLNLILGVVTIFREHSKDMSELKNLLSKAKVPLSIRRQVFMRHIKAKDWKILGPISSPSQSDPVELTPMPEDTDKFATTSYENKQGTFKFAALDKMKSNDSGTAYFTKNFSSTKSKAYLHINAYHADSLDQIKIWVNGAIVDDTTMARGSNPIKSFTLPVKKGNNQILIKYQYKKLREMKMHIGDLYAAPL